MDQEIKARIFRMAKVCRFGVVLTVPILARRATHHQWGEDIDAENAISTSNFSGGLIWPPDERMTNEYLLVVGAC